MKYTDGENKIIFRCADKPKKIKSTKFNHGYCKYVTRKLCPEPFVKKQVQWLDFKKRLSEEKEGDVGMIYNYMDENMPECAKPTVN